MNLLLIKKKKKIDTFARIYKSLAILRRNKNHKKSHSRICQGQNRKFNITIEIYAMFFFENRTNIRSNRLTDSQTMIQPSIRTDAEPKARQHRRPFVKKKKNTIIVVYVYMCHVFYFLQTTYYLYPTTLAMF